VRAWRTHGAFELSGPRLGVEKEIKKARRDARAEQEDGVFDVEGSGGWPVRRLADFLVIGYDGR
jgi:hypothetical protein